MLVPRSQKAPEVEIGKERRCRASLRCPSFLVASLGRTQYCATRRALPHWHRQPALEHRQDFSVGDSPAHAPHQRPVRDGGEVVAEISVYYLPSVILSNVKVRSADGHLRIHTGPEPVLLRRQVRFEDRTEHQHHSGLDHAVLHRRDTQWPLATITFWDPYTKKRLRRISLAPQFFLQRSEPKIHPAG